MPIADAAATGSPLGQRSTSLDLGNGMLPRSVRGESELPVRDTTSTAAANISALMAGGRKRRGETQTQIMQQQQQQLLGTDIDAAVKKFDEMDLYEFKDSSSPTNIAAPASMKEKSHRRHSSVPKDLALQVGCPSTVVQGDVRSLGDNAAAGLAGRSERAASRRRSMLL